MEIITKFHGEQLIKEDEILYFESGLPGFPNEKKFYILPMVDTPFFVMQSIATTHIAFIMIDPFPIFREYAFDIPDDVLEILEIESKMDVAIFVILTVHESFEKTTANLQAPVIINQKKKLAKQYIMNQSSYTTKHSIFQLPHKEGVKKC